ncbi:MAG: hypothetical protein AABY15_02545 [Nanoarchaeota archaeon]
MNNDFFKDLASFYKEQFGADDSFCQKIEDCECFNDLEEFMLEQKKEFSKFLQIDEEIDGLKDEIKDLEDEKSDLEDECHDLQNEVWEQENKLSETFEPKTLWDEQKLETFIQNHEKYSPMEFELLMRAKALKFIKLWTTDTPPTEEVICVNEYNQCIVGYLAKDENGDFYCENEGMVMNEVTHYSHISKLNKA